MKETNEGYTILPPINTERYGNREYEGLEGPFGTKHGKVYYYDTKEGKYYDPDTDFYLSNDEASGIFEEDDQVEESIYRLPPIDADRYPNREHDGLEGPYRNKVGNVYYFCTDSQQYYDPDVGCLVQHEVALEEVTASAVCEAMNHIVEGILQGETVTAREAKLIKVLENRNVPMMTSSTSIIVESSIAKSIIKAHPSMDGFVKCLSETTTSGNIAGSVAQFGSVLKRNEDEVEESEDESEDKSAK